MVTRIISTRLLIVGLALGAFAGCGDDDDDISTSFGGHTNAGGSTSTGGRSSGGHVGVAGAGAGGAGGVGGLAGAGDSGEGGSAGSNTGGTGGTGGTVGAGGLSGGTTALGGLTGNGGTSAGGTPSTSTGGIPSSGGESTVMGGAAGAGGAAGSAGEGGMEAGGSAGAPSVSSLSDAQILLIIDTVNAGEIDEAYAALPRLTTQVAQTFAQTMIDQHSAARQINLTLARTLDLNPSPSALQGQLKTKGEQEVASLLNASTDALDREYITAQVQEHADVLALFAELQQTADDAQLQTELATMAQTVQAHYDAALAVQAQLP